MVESTNKEGEEKKPPTDEERKKMRAEKNKEWVKTVTDENPWGDRPKWEDMTVQQKIDDGPPRYLKGEKKTQIIGIEYDEEGFPVLSDEARKHQSVYENAEVPKTEPENKGEITKTAGGNPDMHIELWDSWIRRTHRSHKPYGKDVDAKFKKRFEDAWKNAENKTWTLVCQEIADNTKDILEHTEQKQTYICCLAKKDSYLRDEKDQNDLRFYVGIKGAGWYLEWDINSEYLLIIKSTC